MKLIGVDVGGTFTDVVFTDTDTHRSYIHKVATTPQDPAIGVLVGIRELCQQQDIAGDSIDHVFHGTTIATNAVLEQDGAVIGMITSAGYRDIVHIGRHQRPQHYSIQQEVPLAGPGIGQAPPPLDGHRTAGAAARRGRRST